MHILIVTQYFWPENFIISGLAVELQKKGHRVTILTGLPNYPSGKFSAGYSFLRGPWQENYQGVQVLRVPILARGTGFFRLALNYISFALSGSLGYFFHHMPDVDRIFCYAPSPVTACLPAVLIKSILRKPLLFWVQDLWPESVMAVGATQSVILLNALTRLVKFIYRQCDILLVPSYGFKTQLEKMEVPESKIKYVPNWAEPFPYLAKKPDWVTNLPTAFRIGFAGNIGAAQDMQNLIQTAILLRSEADIKWIIAGDGSEKEWLQNQIATHGLQSQVLLVGKKEYAEMSPFFEACDALYLALKTSPIFSLTVPSKLQAYMSAGRPILAALDGDGADLIQLSNSGLSVSTQNPAELAKAVLKLKALSLPKRATLGKNAQAYFKDHFRREVVIDHIEKLLLETSS